MLTWFGWIWYLYFLANSLAIDIFMAKETIDMLIALSIISGKMCNGGAKGAGNLSSYA